jgi:DNA-binding SARP family transcriptional activator
VESGLRTARSARPLEGAYRFRILGPLDASGPSGPLDLGGRKQQAVLAVLLLNANRVVPLHRLIEEIWGEARPLSAKTTLHAYVSRLRRNLGGRIETQRSGYSLRVDSLELDRTAFERQADLAQEALVAGNADLALTRLREGLKLWRDRPLRGLPLGSDSQIEIDRLEELHLAMLEQQVDALLGLGRNRDALAELEPLVARHPFREHLREQVMLALYRSGRQADALAEYRATREFLVGKLGIEPGPSLQKLHRHILEQDPRLAVSGEGDRRTARRQTTVLFAAFAACSDPEALRNSVATAAKILVGHGAHVDERPGDGILGVFGLPTTREDDALRALRAATELLAAQAGIRHVVLESGEVLSEGERVLGGQPLIRIGPLGREARAGEILLGEGAQAIVRHYARMGPPSIGGARRLVEIDPGAEAIQRHLEGALVGREVELARLEQAFEAAIMQRSCQLVTVLGNPGIGKSKLAREFAERISQRATVLEGRCPPFGDGMALWPLAEMVRTLAGSLRRKALQDLVESAPDARLIARQLATALGTEEPPDAAEDIVWAVRELFTTLARTRPVVLIFEDVHWAKPSLLDIIEQLVDFSRDAPILIVCLARLELLSERRAWGGGRRNSGAILLSPLSEAESRALGRARSEDLSDSQLESVVERAEGNPLFIEQLLALLAEGGKLAPGAMPPSIQAVLGARLDLLPTPERGILDHASVVGNEFWVGALVELMREPVDELGALIQRLIEKEFLRPSRSELPGEEAYRFQHVLLRDVAYASVAKRMRADLHARFVKWLDASRMAEADRDELAGHHLEQTYRYIRELDPESDALERLAEEAGLRFRRAGSRALLQSDMAAATPLLERALTLLPRSHSHRGLIFSELAPAYRAMGDWPAAERSVREGLVIADANGDRFLESHLRIRDLETQVQLGRVSVRAAERRASAEVAAIGADAKSQVHEWLVFIAWLSALRGQALKSEEILNDLRSTPGVLPRVRLRALRLLPSQWLYGPLPAKDGMVRCRSLLEEADLGKREQTAILRSLAVLTAMQGDLADARRLIAGEEEDLSSLGLVLIAAGALLVHAEIERLDGNDGRAERLLRKGLGRLRDLGETLMASEFASSLAGLLALRGELDEAWALADESAHSRTFDVAAPVQLHSTRANSRFARRGTGGTP